jgi:hypothetical protein
MDARRWGWRGDKHSAAYLSKTIRRSRGCHGALGQGWPRALSKEPSTAPPWASVPNLRFVPTNDDWQPIDSDEAIVREIGTCLRLVECEEVTPRHVLSSLNEAVFDLWQVAQRDIWTAWMRETDPANLQPKVRPLNQRVAEFIRANRPPDDDGQQVNNALDVLEAPWPHREEILLREWFRDETSSGFEKTRILVWNILDTGLEPFNQPQLLLPVEIDSVELVCWMGLIKSPNAD